jgi:SAM-dependent methyltransferase
MKRNLAIHILYTLRDLRIREVFQAIRRHCRGRVLDIGGYDFYAVIRRDPRVSFTKWVNLELDPSRLFGDADGRYEAVIGDGCSMEFPDESFDTLVNIQVLEHVMDPLNMVAECSRVLKPGGTGIFLIPQTSALHLVPYHYYNFTKYWIREAMKRAGLEIVELKPLGGRWSTFASHFFLFFFQSFGISAFNTREEKRNVWFYAFFPFMALYAIIGIPICLLFSFGDLTEEPNNYLVIVTKSDASKRTAGDAAAVSEYLKDDRDRDTQV